jgi:ubiquinone/menaquinone biosynthesis C-methylase UbiE
MIGFRPTAARRETAASPIDVERPRAEAARTYDRLSGVYDLTEGLFERRPQDLGLRLLGARPDERILELGSGTGRCLVALARGVGPNGRVAGLDISSGMHRVAQRRVERTGLADRVNLVVGDGVGLPFADRSFDAVFASFVVELFSSADIPAVLGGCRRVLRPGGRLVVVGLASQEPPGALARAYAWGHARAPRLLDCRPIPIRAFVERSGLRPTREIRRSLFGLPVAAVRAER